MLVAAGKAKEGDPLLDGECECRHPVVYIGAGCCQGRSFELPKVPAGNGNGRHPVSAEASMTQLLPQIRRREPGGGVVYETGAQPVADGAAVSRQRHRRELEVDDDGPPLVKDVLLGVLIGAALTVFVCGLLVAWLFS